MPERRIIAVDHVELESPPGLEDEHRWFYGELALLEEMPAEDGEHAARLRFRSERIELRIRFTQAPAILETSVRVVILVPSLSEVIEQCEDRALHFTRVSGVVWTDRRIQLLDPAGNRVEFKQFWPRLGL